MGAADTLAQAFQKLEPYIISRAMNNDKNGFVENEFFDQDPAPSTISRECNAMRLLRNITIT